MADVRLIDANSVCKKIVESIRCAEEWANEAKEQQDFHGLRCATEAKTSLLAMLARIHDEPTIEAESVNGWISVDDRLPPYGERVFVYIPRPDNHNHIEIAYISKESDDYLYWVLSDESRFYSTRFYYISHWMPIWMPLPEPKGE